MSTPEPDRPPTRREQAAASRRAILLAARDAFLTNGYHGATMGEIADRSGFAVQTVSYFFGTKPRLISALIEATVRRAMGETPPLDHDAWHAVLAGLPHGAAVLDQFVEGVHPVLVDVSGILEVARVGALTDPEVASIHTFHEEWRRRDYAQVVGWLTHLDALRPGLSADAATDVLTTIAGPELYDTLLGRRRWDGPQVGAWVADSLKRLLLA